MNTRVDDTPVWPARVLTFDHRIRSRELDKTAAFDHKPRREIEETVGALYVSRGAKANSRQTTRLHTVCRGVILMDFAVRAKHGKTMVLDIQLIMKKNLAGAESVGDTIRRREIIEPHNHMMKKIDEHNSRDLSIRKSADDAATMLLDNPNRSFNSTNVFGGRGSIQCSVNVISDLVKFIIHENSVNLETCTSIYVHDPMK